jgi:hypothetical protein
MAANNIQKIASLDINANTKATIEGYLAQGYVITHITTLAPTLAKLLIVYTTPDEI